MFEKSSSSISSSKMSIRLRTAFPLITLVSIAFFFWCIRRYDDAAFQRFKQYPSVGHHSPSPTTTDAAAAEKSEASPTSTSEPVPSSKSSCEVDPVDVVLPFTEWLPHKNLSRIYMRPHLVNPNTEFGSLTPIDKQVMGPWVELDRGAKSAPPNKESCPNVVDVDVAADHDVEETSKILFGLATTVDRLDHLLPSLLYSYGNTKAGLIVVVPETDDDLSRQETYFRNRGLDVKLRPSPLDFTGRYFGMVEAFAEHIRQERPQTTWLGFMDDDTFFLSLPTLASELNMFDASKQHYIGALSEASWQVDTFGHIAFGGAGVFISRPLLDVLEDNYDECQSWGDQPGDQKLGQCIQRFAETPLTIFPSLYQMDMKNNVDGFYESGRKIESLHHWNTWYTRDVVKMSAVAAAAGRRSVLRRWTFDRREHVNPLTGRSTRSFWVLTNGYTMTKYTYEESVPDDAINFEQPEHTWEEDPRGYEGRLGTVRPDNVPGITKDRWFLREASLVGDNVHQLYIREEDEGRSMIEIVWLGPKGGGGAGVGTAYKSD